jgi:hypothetical protein
MYMYVLIHTSSKILYPVLNLSLAHSDSLTTADWLIILKKNIENNITIDIIIEHLTVSVDQQIPARNEFGFSNPGATFDDGNGAPFYHYVMTRVFFFHLLWQGLYQLRLMYYMGSLDVWMCMYCTSVVAWVCIGYITCGYGDVAANRLQ